MEQGVRRLSLDLNGNPKLKKQNKNLQKKNKQVRVVTTDQWSDLDNC
jgi:hypothetical protein